MDTQQHSAHAGMPPTALTAASQPAGTIHADYSVPEGKDARIRKANLLMCDGESGCHILTSNTKSPIAYKQFAATNRSHNMFPCLQLLWVGMGNCAADRA